MTIGILLCITFIKLWWVTAVLKHVAIESDQLIISGLTKTIRVPLSEIIKVRDSSHLKRIPSVIVLRSPSMFGTKIRFFPVKPYADAISELRKHIKGDAGSSNKEA